MQNVRTVQAVNGPNGELRCRIGALDHRRVPYKGWVIIEPFGTADGSVRSFCIMQRDEVKKKNPPLSTPHAEDEKRAGRSHIMAKDVQGYCAITATRAIRPPPEGQRTVSEFTSDITI